MFYNVVGLAFVSCFICAVVNAIDDFDSMQEALKRAKQSFKLRSKSGSTTSGFETELQDCSSSRSGNNGNQVEGASTKDTRWHNQDKWHDNKGCDGSE